MKQRVASMTHLKHDYMIIAANVIYGAPSLHFIKTALLITILFLHYVNILVHDNNVRLYIKYMVTSRNISEIYGRG